MSSFTFFQFLYDHLDVAIVAEIHKLIALVANAVQTPLRFAVVIYIAATAGMELFNPGREPISSLIRKIIRAGVVLLAVQAASYTDVFGTFMLTALPNELVNMIGGSSGSGAQSPIAFDKVLGGAWAAGVDVYKGLSVWSSDGLGLMVVVGLYLFLAFIAIGLGFGVFVLMHITTGLLIAIGPLFICLWLFPRTEPYFSRWLSALLALIVTQLLIVAILTLTLGVEVQLIQQIAALNGKGGANQDVQFAQIHYLLEAALLFSLVSYFIKSMPSLAMSIMGGVSPDISWATGMMASVVSAGAATAGRGAAAVSGSAISSAAAGLRSLKPAGRAP